MWRTTKTTRMAPLRQGLVHTYLTMLRTTTTKSSSWVDHPDLDLVQGPQMVEEVKKVMSDGMTDDLYCRDFS